MRTQQQSAVPIPRLKRNKAPRQGPWAKRLQKQLRKDRGSFVIEFVFLAFALIIPLMYAVLTLAALQAGMLAVDRISADAARLTATYGPGVATGKRIDAATAAYLRAYDLPPQDTSQIVNVTYSEPTCRLPNTEVKASGKITIHLPFAQWLGAASEVALTRSHTNIVDPYK